MIEKHFDIYRKEESDLNEKMTFKKALLFTLFDSIFIGLKFGIIFCLAWSFVNWWVIYSLPAIATNVCPLLK